MASNAEIEAAAKAAFEHTTLTKGKWQMISEATRAMWLSEMRAALTAAENVRELEDAAEDGGAPAHIAREVLRRFERSASGLVGDDYATGYREAAEHIISAILSPENGVL